MSLSGNRRHFVGKARVGRLATTDRDGHPHVVPVCFALVQDRLVTPIDAKPKRVEASRLKRVQNVEATHRAALLVDHYEEDWSALGWVRIDGPARIARPEDDGHDDDVGALRAKYQQYETHPLSRRPVIRVIVDRVAVWGSLSSPPMA